MSRSNSEGTSDKDHWRPEKVGIGHISEVEDYINVRTYCDKQYKIHRPRDRFRKGQSDH